MKTIGLLLVLAAIILLVACGTTKTDPSGTWTVTLTPTAGNATAMAMTDTLTTNINQSSDPKIFTASITATNLSVTTNNGCLINGASQTGQYTIDTTTNTFVLNVLSQVNNNMSTQLTLDGKLASNAITGTWRLSATATAPTDPSACLGTGTFIMRLAAGSGFPTRRG